MHVAAELPEKRRGTAEATSGVWLQSGHSIPSWPDTHADCLGWLCRRGHVSERFSPCAFRSLASSDGCSAVITSCLYIYNCFIASVNRKNWWLCFIPPMGWSYFCIWLSVYTIWELVGMWDTSHFRGIGIACSKGSCKIPAVAISVMRKILSFLVQWHTHGRGFYEAQMVGWRPEIKKKKMYMQQK